jgi:hypothetical protein
MPHEHNLLHFIEILTGGVIQIKDGIADIDLQRVRAYINLVGLDRLPGHPDYSDKDDRWDNRIKVYDIAMRQQHKYTQPVPATDVETIVDLARTNGYFSIWYTVFDAFDEVKEALICGITDHRGHAIIPFPGTHQLSFDIHNHYRTLSRA